jgi:tripartite-type tricarboxylate transporter receptor subunit TctC
MLGFVVSGPRVEAQQNYPSGQVTFVVPLPPGGTVDIIARALAEKLQSYTGQPFVVENVTGGNTMLAAERVARAPADGNTLLVATSTTLTTNPQFYRKLRYKIDDFQPVTLLASTEMIVHIKKTLPVANLKELIAYAEKTPGGITYAILGRGSIAEVLGELMKASFKVEMRAVSYRGSALALMDLMKGEIDMHFDSITSTLPHVEAGRSRMIATTGEARSKQLPDIPTLAELGYPNMSMDNIFAMLAPKGTPRPVVDKLNALVRRALAEPQLSERLIAQGAVLHPTTPEELAALLARDSAFFEKNVRELKLPPID